MRRHSIPAFRRFTPVLLLILGGALFVSACAGGNPGSIDRRPADSLHQGGGATS